MQVAREIQIHSHLQHEHIIQLYGAFEDSKHVYLVQEYASGSHHSPVYVYMGTRDRLLCVDFEKPRDFGLHDDWSCFWCR